MHARRHRDLAWRQERPQTLCDHKTRMKFCAIAIIVNMYIGFSGLFYCYTTDAITPAVSLTKGTNPLRS